MIRVLSASLLFFAAASWAADVKQGVAAKNTTVKLQSESLGQERTFNILLPVDYESSTSRYPVLYLLRGHGQRSLLVLHDQSVGLCGEAQADHRNARRFE